MTPVIDYVADTSAPDVLYPSPPMRRKVEEVRRLVKCMEHDESGAMRDIAEVFGYLLREAERGWVSQQRVRVLEDKVEALEVENRNRWTVLLDHHERLARLEGRSDEVHGQERVLAGPGEKPF